MRGYLFGAAWKGANEGGEAIGMAADVRDYAAVEQALLAGDTVFLARQAANRDPQRWNDPDHFDVTRPPERHFSFGYGPHFCLGQAVARLDVQEAVRAFLDEMPVARLLTANPRRVPFTPDEQLEELLVRPG